jgi:hypothetical protein
LIDDFDEDKRKDVLRVISIDFCALILLFWEIHLAMGMVVHLRRNSPLFLPVCSDYFDKDFLRAVDSY